MQAAAAKHAGHARGDGLRPGAGCALTGHPALFDANERRAGMWESSWLGIATTVAANIAHGLEHGLTGAAPGTWPAVALAGSYELLKVIAAIRASRRAWTVAWSSHQMASGDAAWMAPNASPHRTGTRIDCSRGVGVSVGVCHGRCLLTAAGRDAAPAAAMVRADSAAGRPPPDKRQ